MRTKPIWLAALGLSLMLAAPALADHKGKPHGGPGGGGGSGGGKTPVCISFHDIPGHRIQSDSGFPYCDDKRLKVSAFIGQAGGLHADFNTTEKELVGRSLWIDFGDATTTRERRRMTRR